MASALADAVISLAALAVAAAAAWWLRGRRARAAAAAPPPGARRILFPVLGRALSRPALHAALRLARAEEATLVPVYLAEVPRHLPLDCALPRQSAVALALLESVEQEARRFGVAVDARIEKGRDPRHALRETMAHERWDRLVLAAETAGGGDGFSPQDTAWLLANAPGEIVVLRPDRTSGQTDDEQPAAGRTASSAA